MSQSDFQTELIKSLQIECYQENKLAFQEFLEALQKFAESPETSVKELFRISHTLKGNLQAAALPEFAELVHRLENSLGSLELILIGPDRSCLEPIEVALSSCLEGFQFFNQGLAENDPVMSEAGAASAKHYLAVIEAAMAAAPVTSQDSAVHAEQPVEVVPEQKIELAAIAEVAPLDQPSKEDAAPVFAKTEAPPEVDAITGHYLLARAQQSKFAIPLNAVIEIVETKKFDPVDIPVSGVSALFHIKGHCIPILKFVETPQEMVHPYIVVCQIGAYRFGISVDEVMDVSVFKATDFQSNPRHMQITGIAELKHILIQGEHTIFRVEFGGSLFGAENVA